MAIKIELDDDFYLKDASVFGIISELPDYRLCFKLNNDLNLKLCRKEQDKEFYTRKGIFVYSDYSYHNQKTDTYWRLTSNKKGGIKDPGDPGNLQPSALALVADLKVMDYFLWYEGAEVAETESFLNDSLKKLSYVRTFNKINITASRHIKNLLLEY